MVRYARRWPERVWAIEGCQGIGRHIATRLLADGEQVVDVPPKLSARARMFATGQGRKTDATDAHCVALVGTRMAGLRPLVNDAPHTQTDVQLRPMPVRSTRRGTHRTSESMWLAPTASDVLDAIRAASACVAADDAAQARGKCREQPR